MFPDGGETYTIEEVKRLFEEEGVYPKNFEDALSKCIEKGWIIDCGNGNYTREIIMISNIFSESQTALFFSKIKSCNGLYTI